MLPDTKPPGIGHRFLKRFMYAQLSLWDGVLILLGKSQPKVPFTVRADPASVYYNFRISPERQEDFTRYANLPEGMTLCPVRCLEDDPAELLLTLNVYEVSGLASGVRAEWSTYILDTQRTPRFLVLEAASSTYSMDPVDIITRKSRVEHDTSDGQVRTAVASLDEGVFEARYAIPDDAPHADIAPEWAAANDTIYWRNGVCDRVFYDAALAHPRALRISGSDAQIDNRSHWAEFLAPQPEHILHFLDPIDFIIQPWANV